MRWNSEMNLQVDEFFIASQVVKLAADAEESVIREVLKQLLKRTATIEDFKKVTRVFGPDSNRYFPSDFYTLVFDGIALGIVRREYSLNENSIGPNYSVRFTPSEDFK